MRDVFLGSRDEVRFRLCLHLQDDVFLGTLCLNAALDSVPEIVHWRVRVRLFESSLADQLWAPGALHFVLAR